MTTNIQHVNETVETMLNAIESKDNAIIQINDENARLRSLIPADYLPEDLRE